MDKFLKNLKSSGLVRFGGDFWQCNIDNNPEVAEKFFQFMSENDDIDPRVVFSFGPFLAPFVTPAAQNEVHCIVGTFSSLLRADLDNPAGIVFGAGPHPYPIEFHHSQIALLRAMEEIQRLALFHQQCPHLTAIPIGQRIVTLVIFYANNLEVSITLHRKE